VRPARAIAAAVLVALGVAACGGGGGGGGGPTTPPPPTPGITFTPAGSAASPGIALAAGAGSTATRLVLEVRATGISDLYGVAFDLQYPGGVLSYASATNAGSILAAGTFQVSHTASDVVIGETLLGPVRGVSGNGLLATIELDAFASGNGTFTFTRNTAFDSAGRPIAGVTWTAGSVQVVK
jgi:hypothetical protein